MSSVGINIGVGSRPKIFNNVIKNMTFGVKVVSGDPTIIKNKISRCNIGVISKTFQDFLNET
jgi:parallel beta-helix repeat protein